MSHYVVDRATATVDSVHESVVIFHTFYNRKLIHYFWKIVGALDFCKNTTELF
jgi:hypothetical protein